ncbi:uncharacterized protein C8A04DRAFT_29320 [Dichotomopilus funicola]|uniref:Uncharacterized protein n=1 Tax=Dichotomopilus funicola TaxID=1934379 RepID=A0AAN6ZLP9_9PEZI|nr:hypothetical protein C8A04DRAFT_29320 [Dichotomopilus funicola]
MCTYTTHIHTCARCARQETVLISEQICPVARPSGIFGTCTTGILFQQRDAHAGPPPLSLSPRFSTTTSTSTSSPSSSYSTTAGPWTAGSGTPGSGPAGPGPAGSGRQRRSTSGAYRARGYSLNQCWPCREAVRVAIAAAVAAAGEMGGGRWGGRRASGSTSSSSFGYTSSSSSGSGASSGSSSGYGYSTSSGFKAGTALAAGGRGRMEGWVGGRSGSGDGGSGALGVRMEGGGVGVAGDWV